MVGNNSCGTHSLTAGKTVDNIEELEIVTYDGTRMRVGATGEDELECVIGAGGGGAIRRGPPVIPRRVSGYNLDALLPENGFHVARALVGSEGTAPGECASPTREAAPTRCTRRSPGTVRSSSSAWSTSTSRRSRPR
ncbi:hypothetical protein Mro03_69930 [Microbispora rosea subsp. rosea]|nr:hypothetical protein Mro03_69930 [Microbispora rosea subsp. rosea]